MAGSTPEPPFEGVFVFSYFQAPVVRVYGSCISLVSISESSYIYIYTYMRERERERERERDAVLMTKTYFFVYTNNIYDPVTN